MKMDKNTMFMIGAGVLGFVAVRFYLKSRNKNEASSNYIGTGTGNKCRVNIGGVYHNFDCGSNSHSELGMSWQGYTANCSSQGSFGCTVTSPQGVAYNGTKTRALATKKIRSYSSACGCGA